MHWEVRVVCIKTLRADELSRKVDLGDVVNVIGNGGLMVYWSRTFFVTTLQLPREAGGQFIRSPRWRQ